MSPNITDEIKRAVKSAVNAALDEYNIRACCPNCIHFSALGELCKITTPAARPPANVIAFGCSAFKDEDK